MLAEEFANLQMWRVRNRNGKARTRGRARYQAHGNPGLRRVHFDILLRIQELEHQEKSFECSWRNVMALQTSLHTLLELVQKHCVFGGVATIFESLKLFRGRFYGVVVTFALIEQHVIRLSSGVV